MRKSNYMLEHLRMSLYDDNLIFKVCWRENKMTADNQAGKIQYNQLSNEIEKSYLFGVYLGDGCCFKSKSYGFCIVSGDKDVIEKTCFIVNKLFNKKGFLKEIIPNKTILYKYRVYGKSLFECLTLQTNNKSKIPEFVTNSEKEIFSAFVAGLMDTDGYISTGTNKFGWQRFSLGFINSGDWIDDFISLLRNFGVKVGKKTLKKKYRSINEKDCFQININLRRFVENGFYFNCRRKQNLLEKYKVNVRYQSY